MIIRWYILRVCSFYLMRFWIIENIKCTAIIICSIIILSIYIRTAWFIWKYIIDISCILIFITISEQQISVSLIIIIYLLEIQRVPSIRFSFNFLILITKLLLINMHWAFWFFTLICKRIRLLCVFTVIRLLISEVIMCWFRLFLIFKNCLINSWLLLL